MERVPLTLLLFDVDRFKAINDTHGHYTGDRVLQDLTERISRHLRADDVFGRHGGDEFAILLPGMDEADTSRFAETIKKEIETGSIPSQGSSYTFSIGLHTASIPNHRSIQSCHPRGQLGHFGIKL